LEEAVIWEILYKVEEGKIVGFYLLGERKLSATIAAETDVAHEDSSKYHVVNGVEDIALGIILAFRKTDLIEQLKQQVKTIPGLQYIRYAI